VEHDLWTPVPAPPVTFSSRTATRVGQTVAAPIECGPGAHGGRGLAVLDLGSARWTTPCALKTLSNVVFDLGRALIIERPDASSRQPGPIKLYVWEPGRSSWRVGVLPAGQAPANLKERAYGSAPFFGTVHFDGARLWTWGGTAIVADPNVAAKNVPLIGGAVATPRWQ
jgi:hypothetical protein